MCMARSFERDLEGMYAVALQHEMDHLVGKLFVERLSWFRRLRLRLAGKTGHPASRGLTRQKSGAE